MTFTYQKRIGRCKLGDLMWFIKPYHKHRETGDDSGSQVNPTGNLEFIELRKTDKPKEHVDEPAADQSSWYSIINGSDNDRRERENLSPLIRIATVL
jgi:hypothetical protein